MYPRLNVSFKFLFIHKTFFARVCFLMIYLAWQNLAREKWRHEVAKILRGSAFVLFWYLVFMCKGCQPRIYADLLRFQSRVNDPIHIILMRSMIPFFIHSFWVLKVSLHTYNFNYNSNYRGIITNYKHVSSTYNSLQF